MTTSFDPYHRWLSIPPKHQPPDHYRLLGIERFESDAEVIRDAADRQMVHVRSYQLGEYSALSQKVLNEIATARVCLLSPEKKAAYDERLREQLVGQQAVGVPGTSHAAVVPVMSTKSRSRNVPGRIWPVLGGVAGVLVLGLLIWQFAGRGRPPVSEPPRIARKEPPEAPKPPPLPPPAPPQSAPTVAETKEALDLNELGRDNETEQPDADAEVALAAPSEDMSPVAADERGLGDLLKEPEDMAVPPAESAEPAKSPVPERSEQEEVRSMLDEAYGTTGPRTPDEKLKLAGQLASMAEKAENPTERFVLLRRASELATEGGDAAKMLGLVARIADEFDVDKFLAQAHMLNQIATTARSEEQIGSLVQSSADLIDAAMAADRFDLADSLSAAVYRATMEPAGRSFRVEALNRRRTVQQQRDLWSEVQEARNTLQTNPQDDEAHTRIAQWYCFVRGDWEKAVLHFAKGSHAGLRALAHRELEDPPKDVAGQVELADAWWDLAQTSEEPSQSAFLGRAAHWYKQAQPQLTSPLVRAKVAKRLAELAGARPPGTQPAPPLAVAPFDERTAKRHQLLWSRYLVVPVEHDVDLGGGVKLTMVLIPPGEFMMGSPEPERQRALEEAKAANDTWAIERIPTEAPQHRVRITRPFYLGKYEVTQVQWQAVMGNNPSKFQAPANPVETVSWNDIQAFLARLNAAGAHVVPSSKTRRAAIKMTYALPTEAQWEYACRAGTTTAFSFGDAGSMLGQYGWFKGNAGGRTHPVGGLKANAWGLYDMHGNVWEWCADWSGEKYYANSPVDDPPGPGSGSGRVRRGGSWGSTAGYCRSAIRNRRPPDRRDFNLGFRLALVPADE